jgi:cytochrome c oxidase cbb3-type subunit 3
MDKQAIFWLLVGCALLLTFAIFTAANTIKEVLDSDFFREKMDKLKRREEKEEEERKKKEAGGGKALMTIALLVSLAIPSIGFAADAPAADGEPMIPVTDNLLWVMLAVNLALIWVFRHYSKMLKDLLNIDQTEEERQKVDKQKRVDITRVLTDTVPLEEEDSILMDHEYDGIRELDNNLPPWWKWGFYLSILIGVIYMMHYHVLGTGDLQIEAYEKEMIRAEKEIEAYRAAQAMNVDESSVTMLESPEQISSGRALYMKYCKVCHGANGGASNGLAGANLTDEYWLHGGSISDVFKTIKYGAENGMKSWKDELNPIQMQQVASYIKTLKGTNPPNAKEPQGELYIEEVVVEQDSVMVGIDSLQPIDTISPIDSIAN